MAMREPDLNEAWSWLPVAATRYEPIMTDMIFVQTAEENARNAALAQTIAPGSQAARLE
jgi:hypothetical protein